MEDQEKSIKYGLLYILFSKYTDFFLKISVVIFIIDAILIFFK